MMTTIEADVSQLQMAAGQPTPSSSTRRVVTTMAGAEIEPALWRIFQERARKLAIPIEQSDGLANSQKVLVLVLGDEKFAIDSNSVVEVHTTGRITPIPGAADWWLGLVNLRGRLYSVLDFGRWLAQLGLHTRKDVDPTEGQLVLSKAADQTIAIFVDKVQAVRQLAAADIRPPVAESREGNQPFILGITDDLVVLLDLEAIFGEVQQRTHSAVLPT
jgi:purine-binding chemotaxis protein CheW